MSSNLDKLTDQELEMLESALQNNQAIDDSIIDKLSESDLDSLEQQLSASSQEGDAQQEQEVPQEAQTPRDPGSLERKAAQFSADVPAAVRGTPRLLMEAPGFITDVMDIAAKKLQKPAQSFDDFEQWKEPETIQQIGPEGLPVEQRLRESQDPKELAETPDEDLFKPGTFLASLVPDYVKERYEDLKNLEIGGVSAFPTYPEAQKEIRDQLKDPDSFLRKNFSGMFVDDPEIPLRDAADIDEILSPNDTWERYQSSAIGLGVPAALTGGTLNSAVTGGSVGAVDQLLEDKGVSEDDRKLLTFLAAMAIHKGAEVAEESIRGKSRSSPEVPPDVTPEVLTDAPPDLPPDVPPEPPNISLEGFVDEVKADIDSPDIGSGMQMAANLLRPRMKNVNMKQLERAKELGINPTLASVTEGGMVQFGANTLSQNFLTKSAFDKAAERMSGDIENAITRQIDQMDAKDFLDLDRLSEKELGEVPFENSAQKLAESFSDDSLTKFETGENVQTRLNEIQDQQWDAVGELYDKVKNDPLMESKFSPSGARYQVEQLISSRRKGGFKSPDKKAANRQLQRMKQTFVRTVSDLPEGMTKQEAIELDIPIGKKEIPRRMSLRDSIDLLQDLNRVIDFDENIGNQSKVLEPIRAALLKDIEKNMQTIGGQPLLENWRAARQGYGEFAETFGRKNPVVYNAINTATPENIISKAKNASGLQSLLKAFSKSGKKEKSYYNLQKKLIQEIAGDNALNAGVLWDFKMTPQQVRALQEIKPILQMDAQILIDDIARQQKTAKTSSKLQQEMSAIRADIMNSLAQGELPYKTLKMMNNVDNVRKVDAALSGTEQGRSMIESLKKEKAREVIFNNTDVVDGSVNLARVRKNLNENKNQRLLKELLPEDSVSNLQEIGKFVDRAIEGDRAFRNFSQTETARQNAAIIQKFLSTAKDLSKAVLGGGVSMSLIGSQTTILAIPAMYALAKLYTNPNFTRAVLDLSIDAAKEKTPKNAASYEKSAKNVIDIAKENLSDEEFESLQ